MRLRRSALVLLAAAVILTACGDGEPAPEFGAAPAAADADDARDAAPAPGENAAGVIGRTVGTMAPSTTTTTTTTVPAVPSQPTVPAPAVQAICDRVSIFLITAAGLGPNPDPVDVTMLDDSVSQLLDDGAVLYGSLTPEDQDRLTQCLDDAIEAAPQRLSA